jgi:hypothetical protein
MKKGQGIVLLETPRLLMRPTNVFCVLGYQLLCRWHYHLSNTQSANTFLELFSKFNPMVLDLLENLLGLLWEAMLATQLMSVQ